MNNLSSQNQKETELESIVPRSRSNTKLQKVIRILIADDQYTCRQIYQSYLEPESDLEIIGIAVDGQEAISLVERLKPDVVLMDLNMPNMDGLRATEIIKNRYKDTKILVSTISDNVEYVEKFLQVGAKGYILKSTNPQEIVTAIRNVHQGYFQLGRDLIKKLDSDTLTLKNQSIDDGEHHSDLNNPSESQAVYPSKTNSALTNGHPQAPSPSFAKAKPSSSRFARGGRVTAPNKKLVNQNLNLKWLILLLPGLLIFFLTPLGRKWMSRLPILSTILTQPASNAQNTTAATILPVETIEIDLVDSYQVDRTYTGIVVSRRSSSLGFERGGKLLNLTADLGEQVQMGTPLAILDTKNLRAKQQELLAQRKQAQAQLNELQAGSRAETIAAAEAMVNNWQSQLKLAQAKSQRRQELYASGAISREQLDVATADVDTLQARLNESQNKLDELLTGTRPEKVEAQQALLEQLDAELASLELELEQSTLKAPFSGIIDQRLVDEGTVVAAGESIFTLVEAQALEVHVGVPVNTVSQMPVSSEQQLKIGSQIYQAKVLSILPQLDSATRTLTVVLGLEQLAATEVRAGQVARLKLSENVADSGYWLPTSALVKGGRGLWSCYVIGKPELIENDSRRAFRVEQREVEVLQTESDRVFVRGTLQNSDQVIVSGNHRLVPQQLVRPAVTRKMVSSD